MKPVHLRERVSLVDGALRIVAVADTHSEPHPALASRLSALAPGLIVHAGDIGDLAVIRALERHAPVIAVRANIDTRTPGVPDVVMSATAIASSSGCSSYTSPCTARVSAPMRSDSPRPKKRR